MKLAWRVYAGPSPLSPGPSVTVALTETEFAATINDAGVAALSEHCAAHHGFDTRFVPEGGVPARASFLAAWSREVLDYRRGNVGHAGAHVTSNTVTLACGYHVPRLTADTLSLALRLAAQAGQGAKADMIDADLAALWERCRSQHPDYQAGVMISAARSMGLPFQPYLPGTKFWHFGQGTRSGIMFESMTHHDSGIAHILSGDKLATKALMARMGLPTARGMLMRSEAEAGAVAEKIGFPCVTKPPAAGSARGVTPRVPDIAALKRGYHFAARVGGPSVLVERFMAGTEYRLLVFHGAFVMALRRARPSVVGDGQRTVRALVEEINRKRSGAIRKARYMLPIPMDEVMDAQLAEEGATLDTVPEAGQKVIVRSARGRSAGGPSVVQMDVHPKLIAMVEDFVRQLGCDVAGFDLITDDIAADPDRVDCAFLEVNLTPGLPAAISAGVDEVEIGTRAFAPDLGRIATALIVAPAHPAAIEGHVPTGEAVCAGSMLHLPGRSYAPPGEAGWVAVHEAVKDRRVERLTIHATPAEVTRHGFPLDRIDRIDLRSGALPAPWLEVAHRIAAEVLT